MTIHQIVDVISMRHRFVATAGAVNVVWCMPGATMIRRATVGIFLRYLDRMLVDMIVVHMVQVAVMEIIHMAVVLYRRVAAGRAVLMGVVGMMRSAAGGHCGGLL